MNISCGTDIIEVSRIRKSIEENGDKFLKRVFTDKEIEYCESKNVQKYQSYAGRFAGKEAAFKALSRNMEDKYLVTWQDIEIINDEQDRPILNLNNMDINKIESMDISISHCKEYATANVTILER